MRTLCICVDDFGLDEGINRAVVELAEGRRISAASLMVKRAATRQACALARRIGPDGLAVGLHLDMGALAGGRVRAGEILQDGRLGKLILSSYLGLVRTGALRREVQDQLSRFEDMTGRAPAFIDGHQHVHQLPGVRQVLVQEIRLRYGTETPWIRGTRPCAAAPFQAKAELIYALGGRRLGQLAARHGIRTSRHLLGVYGFDADIVLHRRRMHGWLQHSRSGDVLMCHPSAGGNSGDRHDEARRMELSVLRDLDLSGAGAVPQITLCGKV